MQIIALIEVYEKRLKRIKDQMMELQELHAGKELEIYNYHAGWKLGYFQGKVAEIEDIIDILYRI